MRLVLATVALMSIGMETFAKVMDTSSVEGYIKTVDFKDNTIISLSCQTFISTQINFGQDEQIINVDGGDEQGWMATYKDNIPNMLFLKPTAQSDSNLTVVTTKHTYYFHLTSHDKTPVTHPLYVVKFNYPKDLVKQPRISVEKNKVQESYNFAYSFSGSLELKPIKVFDDGIFTYVKLHPNQPIPAVFVVDNKQGEEAIVNIRRQGNVLVVHRVAPQFTLRLGKQQVASLFNQAEILKRKGWRNV